MRKSTVPGYNTNHGLPEGGSWLDLENIASAELSSEDPQHPFEQALAPDTAGWRAAVPGPQLIRLRFDSPQPVHRVRLHFQEETVERSQEFAIFAVSSAFGRKELVRQQWMFSRNGSTTEVEDYTFELKDVQALEIEIDPGRHDKQVYATLQRIQVG